jgi:hypothetical protein
MGKRVLWTVWLAHGYCSREGSTFSGNGNDFRKSNFPAGVYFENLSLNKCRPKQYSGEQPNSSHKRRYLCFKLQLPNQQSSVMADRMSSKLQMRTSGLPVLSRVILPSGEYDSRR